MVNPSEAVTQHEDSAESIAHMSEDIVDQKADFTYLYLRVLYKDGGNKQNYTEKKCGDLTKIGSVHLKRRRKS